jgi:DNA-binding XRE family transcriptional regulator
MGRTLDEILSALSPDERSQVEAEAAKLIEEEHSLREIRKAMALTQVELAKNLGVGQDEISRIENRTDMLVSTLRRYVVGMGGELDIVARFQNHPPIHIAKIGDLAP